MRHQIVRPVDDPQILGTPNLKCGLNETFGTPFEEAHRLHDHAFSTFGYEIFPPRRNFGCRHWVVQVYHLKRRCEKDRFERTGFRNSLHMPDVVAVEESDAEPKSDADAEPNALALSVRHAEHHADGVRVWQC